MEPSEVMDVGRDALWLLIKIATPVMLIAMVVGLVISLFQALTQIQEMTLSFVPKIIAIFISLILLLPFIGGQLYDFSRELAEHIARVE